MLKIKWNTEDVQGWIDFIDSEYLHEMDNQGIYIHDSEDSNGVAYCLGCRVTFDDDRIVLDYGDVEARTHNRRLDGQGMTKIYCDAVRITLSPDDPSTAELIEIREEGASNWRNRRRDGDPFCRLSHVDGVAEGGTIITTHVRRERSRWLRNQTLERQYRAKKTNYCQLCEWADDAADVLLARRYLDTGFYEVHHLTPLSSGPAINRTNDLVVLCPTCHRAAHRLGNQMPADLTELRAALLK